MTTQLAHWLDAMVVRSLARHDRARPFALGMCGAQGIGKSTATNALERLLAARGLRVAVLSLDDLYLPAAERAALAGSVHPLLRTRGVPGTHDVPLGLATLDGLASDMPTHLPRFDKASDTRLPAVEWPVTRGQVDVVLFEGWCVGAIAEPEAALAVPVNRLEREEDADGRWRRFANAALAGPYRGLFGRLDRLVLLAAPSFDVVARWRTEQEHALRAKTGRGMTDAEVARFVLFYERLTRHILCEMPGRADAVAWLDEARRITRVEERLI